MQLTRKRALALEATERVGPVTALPVRLDGRSAVATGTSRRRDGKALRGNLIRPHGDGRTHLVKVVMG